jgi:hypothetical protein
MRTSQLLITASIVAFNAPSFGAVAPELVGALQINSGSAFLNWGRGFRPVRVDTELASGDLVMVAPGGSAEIVYFDDCRIPVKPGQVAVVARISPCSHGKVASGHAADRSHGQVAPGRAAERSHGQVAPGHAAEPQDNSSYYLLGSAAAVGLGAGAWALSKASSGSPAPASP